MNTKRNRVKSIASKFVPALVLVILIPVVTFMYYPMVNMNPQNLTVGIVNLDKGAKFDQGKVNVGKKIINKITDNSEDRSSPSPIIWKTYSSKASASKAMEDGKIYAYLVIPKDFSSSQTSSLKALSSLGKALGNVSTGVDKMGSGVGKMSSNLGKLPTAFNKLSVATNKIATAADKLGTVSNTMGQEASSIKTATESIAASQQETSSSISSANDALSKLKDDISNSEDDKTINEDLETLQKALDNTSSQNSNTTSNVQTVVKNAAMISGQSTGVSQGLEGIKTANTNMSSNFGTMGKKMQNIGPGVNKMSTALNTIGDGLGTMSNTLNDKVTDAIDTANSSQDKDDSSKSSISPLEFYVDQSSNILISTNLGTAINKVSANSGIQIETTYINELPDGTNSMYFLMSFILITMMVSMISAIITSTLSVPKDFVTIGTRLKSIAGQLFTALLVATCAGLAIPRVIKWLCGVDNMDYVSLGIIVGVFSLGLILMTLGAFNLVGKLGMLVPIVTMFCGLAVANLPYEFLPSFWQKYIYDWEPLRILADSIREVVYKGGQWDNDYTHMLMIMTIIGLALMLLSLLRSLYKPQRNQVQEETIEDAIFQQTRENTETDISGLQYTSEREENIPDYS